MRDAQRSTEKTLLYGGTLRVNKMRNGIMWVMVCMMVVGLVSCRGGGGNDNSITGTDQETASICRNMGINQKFLY